MRAAHVEPAATAAPAAQLTRFMGRYDPAVVKVAKQARAFLRRHMPAAHQLVYDNYNALVIGFGPTGRPSDAVLSLARDPRWVTLFFLDGATLPDPLGLLRGSGPPIPARGRGRLTMRSVSAKQRARRPRGRQ